MNPSKSGGKDPRKHEAVEIRFSLFRQKPLLLKHLRPPYPSVRLSQRTRENQRIGSGSATRHPGEITAHDGPTNPDHLTNTAHIML